MVRRTDEGNQVSNQTYLREMNKRKVLGLLCARPQSYSDIARALGLSVTAISNIIDDLIGAGIVLRSNENSGRSGITLCVNPERGNIVAIDLAGSDVLICLVNLAHRILGRVEIKDVVLIRDGHLDAIMDGVQQLLSLPEAGSGELLCIAVGTPGRIDKETGKFILAPRFEHYEGLSLHDMFAERFGCRVVVKNDINLALAGECEYGSVVSDAKNAIMLHLDIGTGAAVMLDGKIYEGSNGFAGEIGYYSLNCFSDASLDYGHYGYGNEFDKISFFGMIKILENCVTRGEPTLLSEWVRERGRLDEDMVIRAYRENDPLCVSVVDMSARVLGCVLKNLADFLDIDVAVLNGAVVNFGQRYLDAVSDAFHKGQNKTAVKLAYSDLTDRATILGAIRLGIAEGLNTLLERKD